MVVTDPVMMCTVDGIQLVSEMRSLVFKMNT